MSSRIISGAGPFYYNGNKLGILLLHGGGGGTAVDLKPLAVDLHTKYKFTIRVPVLPGYGTSPEELRETRVSTWLNATLKEIEFLKESCEQVIIGGHSMGGILALILASKVKVNGLISIATPIAIKGFLPKLAPFLKLFIKYHSIESEKLREETNNEWNGYDKVPLNMIDKLRQLLKIMKKGLNKISCPVILFQGRLDNQIKTKSMDYIYEHIRSKIKRKIWLENNDHPILKCPDHNIIVREIIEFITEHIWINEK